MSVLDRLADLVAKLFVTAPDHPHSGGNTGEESVPADRSGDATDNGSEQDDSSTDGSETEHR